MFRLASIPSTLSRRSGLLAAGLLLLLAPGAAPAPAATMVISSPITGPLVIGPGDKVNIVTGGSVTLSDRGTAVIVNGGTLNVTDGLISSNGSGVQVMSGTVKISGGSIVGGKGDDVRVFGGTVSISGGSFYADEGVGVVGFGGAASISGGTIYGVYGGTVSVYGCGLALSDGYLTGTLRDGTLINTPTSGLTEANLINKC